MMKIGTHLIFVLFAAVLAPAASTAQVDPDPALILAQEDWVEFFSNEGRFRIMAPGVLEEKVDTFTTFVGPMAYHTFFYQPLTRQGDNELFLVSYCDYPEGSLHSDSTDLLNDFFDVTVESAVESVKGELRYADDIRLRRYPGKLWRIDYLDGKAVVKSRAYLVGNRFYSIQVFMFADRTLNPQSDRFLRSFRVMD